MSRSRPVSWTLRAQEGDWRPRDRGNSGVLTLSDAQCDADEHLVDDGLYVAILVVWMALLEGPPVIAEDLREGVFVDPLHCGGHRACLYHVLAATSSRFFTFLSPSLPIAAPGGAGRRGGF